MTKSKLVFTQWMFFWKSSMDWGFHKHEHSEHHYLIFWWRLQLSTKTITINNKWQRQRFSIIYAEFLILWATLETNFNPILRVRWNDVNPCVGAIMARMGFRHSKAVKRQPKAQKWLASSFFIFEVTTVIFFSFFQIFKERNPKKTFLWPFKHRKEQSQESW